MSKTQIVKLRLDASPLLSALREFLDMPRQVFDLPVGFFHAFDKLFSLENDGAVGVLTGEIVIRAEPTDLLRQLITTMRAGNIEFGTVVKDIHANPQGQLTG